MNSFIIDGFYEELEKQAFVAPLIRMGIKAGSKLLGSAAKGLTKAVPRVAKGLTTKRVGSTRQFSPGKVMNVAIAGSTVPGIAGQTKQYISKAPFYTRGMA